MTQDLVIKVDDLIGHAGRERAISGVRDVSLRLGDTTISGPMAVTGRAVGTVDGVQASFEAAADMDLVCTRCLTAWSEQLTVKGEQHFAGTPDEDGYGVFDGEIDLADPAQDELALGMPVAPVCREACLGLCPTCGTDLNSDPCDGHGEDSGSPFAVLRDLFDS